MLERFLDYWLTFRGIICYKLYLKKSCYSSKEEVKKRQFKQLKRLLLECQNYVPYYHKLFKEIGFDVIRDFKTLSDITKIPITSKNEVKTHPELFRNPHYRGGVQKFHTSGSTGTPLTEYISNNHWIIEQGVIWRHWSWAGYRFRDKMAIVRSYTPKNGRLIKMDKIRNFRYYSPFHLSEDNIKMYLEDMVKEKVKFLRGYPSSIKPLAQYVLKNKCKIPKLKGILTASEILPDTDRRIIESAFNCKIFNHYGLAEAIVMMGDCERHEGLHNYDEYGYLELLDTETPNIKKIIGTNLNNYAMPLLRYETNDLAEIKKSKCSCGRSSMIIHNVIGRSNSTIRLKDRNIPLTNFYTMLEYYTTLSRWQIVQTAIDRVELRLQGTITNEELNTIKKEFSLRLPEYVTKEILLNEDLIQKSEGKIAPFISLL